MTMDGLTSDQRALAECICEISERRYRAGWMLGIEAEVWHDLVGAQGGTYRRGLSSEEFQRLKTLSDRCGGWIALDHEGDCGFVAMEDWLARCAADDGIGR
ncbi:hypothetical protein CDN99_09840 [Roseateles aquatilis]|uniref:Uncharacterized protein n=2 Tax=Roseateles aquatilis TaxID=431061 RepID=A0A246JFQ5_9BURK|nr:hypothetical protein CDN99_09840 [Roseateles aquatilis]